MQVLPYRGALSTPSMPAAQRTAHLPEAPNEFFCLCSAQVPRRRDALWRGVCAFADYIGRACSAANGDEGLWRLLLFLASAKCSWRKTQKRDCFQLPSFPLSSTHEHHRSDEHDPRRCSGFDTLVHTPFHCLLTAHRPLSPSSLPARGPPLSLPVRSGGWPLSSKTPLACTGCPIGLRAFGRRRV